MKKFTSGKTKTERIKQHKADTASNQSAIRQHYELTDHHLDKDNVTILCQEEKKCPQESERGQFISSKNSASPEIGTEARTFKTLRFSTGNT